jgi:hypothetical protein
MDDTLVKIGMLPSPPGEFIREEILAELLLYRMRRVDCRVCGVRV